MLWLFVQDRKWWIKMGYGKKITNWLRYTVLSQVENNGYIFCLLMSICWLVNPNRLSVRRVVVWLNSKVMRAWRCFPESLKWNSKEGKVGLFNNKSNRFTYDLIRTWTYEFCAYTVLGKNDCFSSRRHNFGDYYITKIKRLFL